MVDIIVLCKENFFQKDISLLKSTSLCKSKSSCEKTTTFELEQEISYFRDASLKQSWDSKKKGPFYFEKDAVI